MLVASGCLMAAGNWWNTWRSVEASEPGGAFSDQSEQRMLFWLTWTALAALAAGVVWAVRRWGRRGAGEAPDALLDGRGAPAASGAASAGAVVIGTPPTTRLDWKVPTSPRPLHWTDRLRWALGVGWVALLLIGVLAGTRAGTFEEVRTAVASGAVHEVTVAGGLTAAESGTTTQQVLWREGWTQHRAEVTWSTSSAGADDGGVVSSTTSDGAPVLGRDVADVLREAQPGLVVHRGDLARSSTTSFLGWYLPAPQVVGPLYLAGALVLLFLIMNVPPTWRLTRWAWFWIGFTPVGAVLFALFAGPTPGLPRPRHPTERIGGLLAFVVSLVAGGLLRWGSA